MDMTETTAPARQDEVTLFDRFVSDPRDLAGLAAYALHCRARMAFESEFLRQHARAPQAAEMAAFMLGETLPARIATYRAEAEAMRGSGGNTEKKKTALWPFFGLWVPNPLATGTDPEKVNWRGLFWRLAILLGAVVTTALLLRVLVVRA